MSRRYVTSRGWSLYEPPALDLPGYLMLDRDQEDGGTYRLALASDAIPDRDAGLLLGPLPVGVV